MESFKLLASVLLLITEAHAWGAQCTCPVDCSVTEWTSWSDPVFADIAIRTRSVLRTPAHNGTECPHLSEEKQTGTLVTTKQVADVFTNSFLSQHAVRRARATRQAQSGQRRDLLVILDASGSIGTGNFQLAIDQVVKLLALLCPKSSPFDDDIHKLAVIRYASSATEIFDFNEYTTTFTTLQAVSEINFTGGGTNTAEAFKLAINMFVQAKGARLDESDVIQEILILTDGQSNDPVEAIAAAQSLHENVDVFGLIIGKFSDAGRAEVLQYVSYPIKDHLFWLPTFNELEELVKLVEESVATHKCAPFDI